MLAALAAAGTHSGACAWRWLRVQGAAVKHLSGLEAVDRDAERLSILLMSLPALESLSVAKLERAPRCTSPADTAYLLAGSARAIGRCPCLLRLKLDIMLDSRKDLLPDTFGRDLAGARTLEGLEVAVRCGGVDNLDISPPARISRLVAGLAGLSRLRALTLELQLIRMDAPLPACLSRLAQLTSLRLSGFHGLRCAPGWARLPSLRSLRVDKCSFAANGEVALPGMDALTALTGLELVRSPGLLVFPAGIVVMRRLKHLDLSYGGFEHLPEDVSVLTALEELRLGWYPGSFEELRHGLYDGHSYNGLPCIGGSLDARALGSLACFPRLRRLSFYNCCVLFCPSIQAAAVHPCLERLRLHSSYPACGPSWLAFLNFVGSLLQQGRPDALDLRECNIRGTGEQDCSSFCAALQAMGVPRDKVYAHGYLCDDD